jgi:anthranilate synthase/aminodeoxychorismate synthase-like glutamine amidotransferase
LFVDNLDSFSWNIVHACSQLGAEVILINGRGGEKKLPIEEILRAVKPTHIIIGPGPGWPANSLLTQELAAKALAGDIFDLDGNKIPLLGICLGHQAIGEAAGWKLSPAPSGAVHGVTEEMLLQNNPLFSRMDDCQRMMRYHSLVLEPTNENLDIIATDISKTLIMGISHIDHPVWGVQFHPESCGSPEGWKMLENFLTVSFRVPSQSVEVPLAGRQV